METSVSEGDTTLLDVVKMLTEIKKDNKIMERELGRSIERCHSDVEDVLKKLTIQEKQLDLCLQKIEAQAQEISGLKKENEMLHREISDLQQYSRVNCLELHNYPVEKNEDLVGVVKSVGSALGHPISEQLIDNCHRLPSRKGDSKSPPAIIIKFTRRIDKEELLRKRRIKRDFSTRHLGLASDIPLYLNESLAPERRRVLALARRIKAEKGYKYLWIRNGKILMRKIDGQAVIVLETESDLSKLT